MEKKVFLADHIITMAKETKPEAILSIDGRIAFVGGQDEVLKQAGEGAEVFDFTGAAILPGFIDAHSHILRLCKSSRACRPHESGLL